MKVRTATKWSIEHDPKTCLYRITATVASDPSVPVREIEVCNVTLAQSAAPERVLRDAFRMIGFEPENLGVVVPDIALRSSFRKAVYGPGTLEVHTSHPNFNVNTKYAPWQQHMNSFTTTSSATNPDIDGYGPPVETS